MRRPDQLQWTVHFDHWFFSLALGLAAGLIVAAALKFRSERRAGAGLALAGIALLFGTVAAGYDAAPTGSIRFQLKPYLSTIAEAAWLGLGALLGIGLAVLFVVSGGRLSGMKPWREWATGLATVAVGAGVVASLWAIDSHNAPGPGPRFPKGIVRSETVSATRVIEGMDVPTGLAIAPNGDMATLELLNARLRIFRPSGAGFALVFETRLPVVEGAQGLHVIFHPDYPAQPFLYATADNDTSAGRVLQLFRVDAGSPAGQAVVLVDGLPVARREEIGHHFGSGLAFCRGSLFLGTGDTEPQTSHGLPLTHPLVIRHEAQSMESARGKILRWRLSGIDLVPEGLAGATVPVYAFGFRNPFGVGCDAETGFPVVADNGSVGQDQLRLVRPGTNAEWPLSGHRDILGEPLFDTGAAHTAPTGVAVRTTESGREILWTAFQAEAVFAIAFDSSGGATGELRLLSEVDGGAYAVATDARGCAYFSSADAVWRLDEGRCSN